MSSPLTPIALGAATLLAAVVLLLGCVCCRQQKGFQVSWVGTRHHEARGAGEEILINVSKFSFLLIMYDLHFEECNIHL